jgi:hypothetical protein
VGAGRAAAAAPTLIWRAGMAGRHAHLMVNGDAVVATVTLQENDPNLTLGQSVRVSSFR